MEYWYLYWLLGRFSACTYNCVTQVFFYFRLWGPFINITMPSSSVWWCLYGRSIWCLYMVVQPNHLDNHKLQIYECNALFFFISIIFFGSQWYMEEDQHRQEWGWCRWCLLALAMSCKTISLQYYRSSTHVEHISALCDSMLCYSVDR